MSVLPKIFVGTLHVNEAEFDACVDAIRNQEGVEVTHHVISNRPEAEAHTALWSAWNNAKGAYDLFVKIDADTILMRPTALSEVWALFEADSDVTGAQIPLLDYFTRGHIPGLNCFSPDVVFNTAKSKLFCDHADSNHRTVLRGDAVAHLAPIAWHCKYPHPEQAFHFGLHRALKKQREIIVATAQGYLEMGDEGRMWALAGAQSASMWMRLGHNYNSRLFKKSFANFRNNKNFQDGVLDYAKRLVGC